MKTILVPTDFSEISMKALNVAVKLAKENKAQIKLMTMVEFPALEFAVVDSAVFTKNDYNDNVINEARREIERLKEAHPEVKIIPIVKPEEEALTPAIVEEKTDLIVMGSTGASGWKEVISGSHAQYVVRYAECPVLVVKDNHKDFDLKKVLYVTDFSNTEFIKEALGILHTESVQNNFLYIDTGMKYFNGKMLTEKADQLAQALHLEHFEFTIYNAATVERGIIEYAEEIEADLIVMYTHGRDGLERIFEGSVAEDVVNHSPIPVMTILG